MRLETIFKATASGHTWPADMFICRQQHQAHDLREKFVPWRFYRCFSSSCVANLWITQFKCGIFAFQLTQKATKPVWQITLRLKRWNCGSIIRRFVWETRHPASTLILNIRPNFRCISTTPNLLPYNTWAAQISAFFWYNSGCCCGNYFSFVPCW